MQKRTIIVFCYRIMDFRILNNTGILDKLAEKLNVILVVPKDNVEFIRKIINEKVVLETIKYKNYESDINFKFKVINLIKMVLKYVYFIPKDYEKCKSQKFELKNFIGKCIRGRKILFGVCVVFFVHVCSRSLIACSVLQKIYSYLAKNDSHEQLFKKYKPHLVIVGSLGVDVDGFILLEAKKNRCRTVTIIQTWDRSTCRGYPSVCPDNVLVWSDVMKDEVHHYLNIPKNSIFVEGSPVWDNYFKKDRLITRNDFFSSINFDPSGKLIFYPLNSAFWHRYTLLTISVLVDAIKEKKIGDDIQIILRMHPYYWNNKEYRDQLIKNLKIYESYKFIYFDENKVIKGNNNAFLDDGDQSFQINAYYHSDVCISAVSTCMVESIFCNTPAINLEYGRWETGDKEVDIKDFALHHLQRIYSYNVVNRVFSLEELLSSLKDLLINPVINNKNREFLLKNEVSTNRGIATDAYVRRLLQLVNS